MTRRLALAVAACLVAVLVGVGGWAAFGHHQGESITPGHGWTDHDAALKAARTQQATVDGTFLVATFMGVADKRVRDSNTGHPCTSGRVVRVRLLWDDDANFTHGAIAGGAPDGPHKALIVTADATNGEPCLVGASYADDDPRPGETYLYGPRKDLVTPP